MILLFSDEERIVLMEDLNGQPKSPATQQEETMEPLLEATQPLSSSASADAGKSADLVEMAQSLLTEMQELRHDFDTKIKYDETKERQLDTLHKELQTYREGLHFKILRPLFIDLIAMHDDLDKLIEGLSSTENEQMLARMIDNLRSFKRQWKIFLSEMALNFITWTVIRMCRTSSGCYRWSTPLIQRRTNLSLAGYARASSMMGECYVPNW